MTAASIFSPTHPVHTLPKHLCKFNFNIILASVLRSCRRNPSFMFPRLHVYIFPFSSIRATRSARLILRDLITRTFGEDYRSWSSSSLLPQLCSSAPDLQRPKLCSYHNLRHPHHITSQSVLPDDAVPRLQRLLVESSIADAWTQLYATPCGAWSKTSALQQVCSPVLVGPWHYHSTNAPQSHFIIYHTRDITPSASLKKIIMNTTHWSKEQQGQCMQHLSRSDSTRLDAFSTAELCSCQQILCSVSPLWMVSPISPLNPPQPPMTVNQIMPCHVLANNRNSSRAVISKMMFQSDLVRYLQRFPTLSTSSSSSPITTHNHRLTEHDGVFTTVFTYSVSVRACRHATLLTLSLNV